MFRTEDGNEATDQCGTIPRAGPALMAFALFVDVVIRSLYRIHVTGLENHSHSPSTLVVTNHQHDADGPIIASMLLDRHGVVPHGTLPWFVAREDLFRRGFLAEYLETWPVPLREPMRWLWLGWFLRFMQARPMRRIPERSLHEVLEDVLRVDGDLPLETVLRPAWRRRVEALAGGRCDSLRVTDVLRRRRYRDLLAYRNGLRRLTLRRFRSLKPGQRRVIDEQLALFTRLLDRGETVLLAPEGAISLDGRFHEMRNALPALVQRPRNPARVLPVGITHDFMAGGREHVFVNVGPELTGLKGCSRRELCEQVASAVQSLLTVTATQLASDYLIRIRESGKADVDADRLCAHVSHEAERFAAARRRVDARLLKEKPLVARVAQYLDYCERFGTLEQCETGHYRLVDVDGRRPSGWRYRERPVRLAGNQLAAMEGTWQQHGKAH